MATSDQKLTNLMRSNDALMAENQRLRLQVDDCNTLLDIATHNLTSIGLRLEQAEEQNTRLKQAYAELQQKHQQAQQAAPPAPVAAPPRKRR